MFNYLKWKKSTGIDIEQDLSLATGFLSLDTHYLNSLRGSCWFDYLQKSTKAVNKQSEQHNIAEDPFKIFIF